MIADIYHNKLDACYIKKDTKTILFGTELRPAKKFVKRNLNPTPIQKEINSFYSNKFCMIYSNTDKFNFKFIQSFQKPTKKQILKYILKHRIYNEDDINFLLSNLKIYGNDIKQLCEIYGLGDVTKISKRDEDILNIFIEFKDYRYISSGRSRINCEYLQFDVYNEKQLKALKNIFTNMMVFKIENTYKCYVRIKNLRLYDNDFKNNKCIKEKNKIFKVIQILHDAIEYMLTNKVNTFRNNLLIENPAYIKEHATEVKTIGDRNFKYSLKYLRQTIINKLGFDIFNKGDINLICENIYNKNYDELTKEEKKQAFKEAKRKSDNKRLIIHLEELYELKPDYLYEDLEEIAYNFCKATKSNLLPQDIKRICEYILKRRKDETFVFKYKGKYNTSETQMSTLTRFNQLVDNVLYFKTYKKSGKVNFLINHSYAGESKCKVNRKILQSAVRDLKISERTAYLYNSYTIGELQERFKTNFLNFPWLYSTPYLKDMIDKIGEKLNVNTDDFECDERLNKIDFKLLQDRFIDQKRHNIINCLLNNTRVVAFDFSNKNYFNIENKTEKKFIGVTDEYILFFDSFIEQSLNNSLKQNKTSLFNNKIFINDLLDKDYINPLYLNFNYIKYISSLQKIHKETRYSNSEFIRTHRNQVITEKRPYFFRKFIKNFDIKEKNCEDLILESFYWDPKSLKKRRSVQKEI